MFSVIRRYIFPKGARCHPGIFKIFLLGLILITSAGCAHAVAKETPADRTPSYAISPDTDTTLRRTIVNRAKNRNGMSGFKVLRTGEESFALRMALIENAEKSLDLQYYAIHDDVSANMLVQAIVRAASRGVRVRFIIDAINLGEVEDTFATLDTLENIEVRAFNPLTTRKQNFVERMFTRVTNLGTLNKRMHNKALIADNQMAIMGGRNLGDAYFEKFTNATFKDIDILAAGPIVTQISRSFDEYWNNESTITIKNVVPPVTDEQRRNDILADLSDNWNEVVSTRDGLDFINRRLTDRIADGNVALDWSYATMNADDPDKIDPEAEETGEDVSEILLKLDDLLERAQEEFIIVTPYFVPMQAGVEWLTTLEENGIDVKIITNSLATNDIIAVHTGYEDYRRPLLKAGVDLYELKPITDEPTEQRLLGLSSPAQTSLHSKVFVVDRHDSMIGSFNLDPRSINLNTEAMLSIYSPVISGQLAEMFDEVTSPENSYKLELDARGSLVWITENNGKKEAYYTEPEVTFSRRIQAFLMSLLPIEEHL